MVAAIFVLTNDSSVGNIPDNLGNFSALNTLLIGYNLPNVSGPIPDGIKSLANLETLWISGTKLSTLPATLPPALKILDLSGNKLEGEITAETVEKWGSLEYVYLSRNQLKGSPEPLFAVGKSLKYLSLASNHFWFNMSAAVLPTGLTDLDLSYNQIFWTISQQVNDLKNLSNFRVRNNLLFGAIPSGLSKMLPSAFDNNFCLCGPPLKE